MVGYNYVWRNARRVTINGSGLVLGSFRICAAPCTCVNEGQIARARRFVIKRGYADSIFTLEGEFHEERLRRQVTRYSAWDRRRQENGSRNRIMSRQDVLPGAAEGRWLVRHRKDISRAKGGRKRLRASKAMGRWWWDRETHCPAGKVSN